MKKIKRLTFLEWNNLVLINSFRKIGWNILLIVLLDALFYALSGLLVFFWFQRVKEKITPFQMPSDLITLGFEKAQQLVSEIRTFYFLIIASFILLLVAIIFLASILKGMIWAKTTKTKISLSLISKFLLLNLIWMGFWFIIVFLISILVEPTVSGFVIAAAIALSIYFTNTLYALFMKEQKISVILASIKMSATKIHFFALPYFAIILLSFILVKATALIKFKYSPILTSLLIIFCAALIRYYHSTLVLEIENKKPKSL